MVFVGPSHIIALGRPSVLHTLKSKDKKAITRKNTLRIGHREITRTHTHTHNKTNDQAQERFFASVSHARNCLKVRYNRIKAHNLARTIAQRKTKCAKHEERNFGTSASRATTGAFSRIAKKCRVFRKVPVFGIWGFWGRIYHGMISEVGRSAEAGLRTSANASLTHLSTCALARRAHICRGHANLCNVLGKRCHPCVGISGMLGTTLHNLTKAS